MVEADEARNEDGRGDITPVFSPQPMLTVYGSKLCELTMRPLLFKLKLLMLPLRLLSRRP